MLTAYDYPTALALDAARARHPAGGRQPGRGGAGLRQHPGASPLEMMGHHVRAVRNGVTATHICGDLTAGTYRDPRGGRARAPALLVEAGADSVKLEGGLIAAGARDHRRRHPGDGPRRPAAPDRRGLPPRGHDARGGRPDRGRGPRPGRGRLLRDRDRGGPGRARRAHHGARWRCPTIGIAAGPGVRRPGARLDRPHRPAPGPAALREAEGQRPRHRRRGRRGRSPTTCAA